MISYIHSYSTLSVVEFLGNINQRFSGIFAHCSCFQFWMRTDRLRSHTTIMPVPHKTFSMRELSPNLSMTSHSLSHILSHLFRHHVSKADLPWYRKLDWSIYYLCPQLWEIPNIPLTFISNKEVTIVFAVSIILRDPEPKEQKYTVLWRC